MVDRLAAMKDLLGSKQVAELLGIHRQTLKNWVSSGKIPHSRLGSRIKFDPGALATWLAHRTLIEYLPNVGQITTRAASVGRSRRRAPLRPSRHRV
jgi:excisionase family DNA binding protein